MSRKAVSYGLHPVGLSNQLLGLLGLAAYCRALDATLALPRWVNLSTANLSPDEAIVSDAAFSEVLDAKAFARFAAAIGIDVTDRPATKDVAFVPMFQLGLDVGEAGWADRGSIAAQFWQGVRPAADIEREAQAILAGLFGDEGAQAVIQLRIEPDWVRYERGRSRNPAGSGPPSYQAILKAAAAKIGSDIRRVIITCDEARVPVEEIRDFALAELGLVARFKSDFAGHRTPRDDYLKRSLIDLTIARAAPIFVGAHYSTFADAVHAMRLASDPRQEWIHYSYRSSGTDGTCELAERPTAPRPPGVPDLSPLGDAAAVLPLIHGVFGEGRKAPGPLGWLRCRGRGAIRAFAVDRSTAEAYGLAYRGRLADGTWTNWTTGGEMAGSETGDALIGLAVRSGQEGTRVEVRARFLREDDVRSAAGGEASVAPKRKRPLQDLQIVIRPAAKRPRIARLLSGIIRR